MKAINRRDFVRILVFGAAAIVGGREVLATPTGSNAEPIVANPDASTPAATVDAANPTAASPQAGSENDLMLADNGSVRRQCRRVSRRTARRTARRVNRREEMLDDD